MRIIVLTLKCADVSGFLPCPLVDCQLIGADVASIRMFKKKPDAFLA
jgi:hypothetical protein